MSKQQRKKPKPLPSVVVLRRIDKMIGLINREVHIGLEVRASLESANLLIRGSLRGKEYRGAECYRSVQGSQSMFLALTLAKLFEAPSYKGETLARRYNRSDVASIPLLIRLLRQKRTRTMLAKRARRRSRRFSDVAARRCGDAIDSAIAQYTSLAGTGAGKGALVRLRNFRNKLLAHLRHDVTRRSAPKYSQLFLLMNRARDVTSHALIAIHDDNVELNEFEEERKCISAAFWEPALRAAAMEQC